MTFLQPDRSPGRERVENTQALGEAGTFVQIKTSGHQAGPQASFKENGKENMNV